MDQLANLTTQAARLSQLIEDRIGPRGPDLSVQLRKAGRRLPRWVRRDVDQVSHAMAMAGQPKLARQVDVARVGIAAARAVAFLEAIDVSDRRRGALLSMLGAIAFNVLVLAALVVALLLWRGLV